MTELEKLDKQYIAPTYNRFPVDILTERARWFSTKRAKDISTWARESE